MPASKKERQSARERIQRTEAYADKVRQQFAGAVNDILALNKRLPELPEGQMYSFNGAGKRMNAKVDNILRELHSATVATVRTGITQEWMEANKAVDEILASALGRKALSNPNLAGWFDRNEKAMDAFLKRTQDGFNLSRRIWNTTTQLKEEMEVAMTVAIGEGESASAMSRRVRQYLDDPDLMFRRFRYKDDEGNWQREWKKKVMDSDGHYHFVDYDRDSYKVGQGQYKSAYKNAMRVTRTETNIAYRRADHERWQQLDFVLGQRIQTSNSHPKEDICDELAGDYPKDFVFDGWHPQCFCICTPIMADEEEMRKEMDAVLAGEDYEPSYKPITTYPEGFQKFLDENREKIERAQKAGTAPYFIENNEAVVQRRFEGEDLTQGNKESATSGITQERRDNAPIATTREEADNMLRGVCGEVWQGATKKEKQAIYAYTGAAYKEINAVLRENESDNENTVKRISDITNIIDKSTYDKDITLKRAERMAGLLRFGLTKTEVEALYDANEEELQKLVGKQGVEKGFLSTTAAENAGLNLNLNYYIFTPKGTKMMYTEPFSESGLGDRKQWDGKTRQGVLGREMEVILQRGTKLEITKVQKGSNGKINIWVDVVEQDVEHIG